MGKAEFYAKLNIDLRAVENKFQEAFLKSFFLRVIDLGEINLKIKGVVQMNFAEALKLLEDGESLCRMVWEEADGYLKLLDGMLHVWKVLPHPSANAGNYIFPVEDFKATDWVKLAEKKAAVQGQPADGEVEL